MTRSAKSTTATMRSTSRVTLLMTMIVLALAMALPLSVIAVSDRELVEAQSFRESMGLAAGAGVARESLTDASKYPDTRWGVPLTKAEAAEMERRSAERPMIQPAINYAIQQASSGGVYLDQTQGAKPIFLFTKEAAKRSKAIGERLADGIDYAVKVVDYSMREMRALQAVITDDIEELAAEGIPVAQVGVGVEENQVLVGLERASPGAKAHLRERYGPMVTTEFIGPSEFDACNARNDCRPIKGGIRMGRGGQFRCTTGFIGKRRDNGTRVVLTPGHCLTENGGTGCGSQPVEWKHNGNVFGCAKSHSLPACTPNCPDADADVGWIKTDANEDVKPRNQIMASSKYDLRSIERVLSGSDLVVNDILCRAGGNTAPGNEWKCGKLKKKCVNKPNGEGWKILCVATVNFDSLPGDSGGPYIRSDFYPPAVTIHKAVGIHSHSSSSGCSTCRSWFTKANRVESNSPADICTSRSC